MESIYISIEKNVSGFDFYKELWNRRGIIGIRADSMTEGIETALTIAESETQSLYFIDIVADDIDFLPLLPVLDEAVNVPIIVAASKSHYSEDEHHMALNCGASFYGQYCDDPEKNINGVLAAIKMHSRTAKKQIIPPDILYCGGVLISRSRHKAYINDSHVPLTTREFDVLKTMLSNVGKVMTHGDIYRSIYDSEYDEDISKHVVYNTMNRLSQKLRDASKQDHIQSVYDKGYIFALDSK